MKLVTLILAAILRFSVSAFAQSGTNNTDPNSTILRKANVTYGPPVEEVHYYYKQFPIGLSVSSTGRIFACYTRGDYDFVSVEGFRKRREQTNHPKTLGLVVNKTAEVPFPSSGPVQNLPVSQLNTSFNGIQFGSANKSGLISVQALALTSATDNRPETLWVLDTGRPTITDSQNKPTMPYGQPGGPKVVAINLTATNDDATSFDDTAYETFTFPPDVHYPDSAMNDIRLDLRPNIPGTSGRGIAYIVDSSNEGRNGFIMLDLGDGSSWRRLTQDPSVLRGAYNVPSYLSKPFYVRTPGMPITTLQEGLDGIQITPDGSRVYYSPLTTPDLWSVPTANLRARDDDPLAELAAHGNISHHGQRGADANGFEGDDQGRIYQLMPTENAIYYYDPRDLQTHPFVQDPRILWPDSANIGADGYLYMNINQLFFQDMWNNGVDLRTFPGAILRVKLPDGAGKINLG